jgi:hypothetical protein
MMASYLDWSTGAAFVAGLLIGTMHFIWLGLGVQKLAADPSGNGAGSGGALLAGAMLRLATTLACFGLVARFAPTPGIALIAALAGFTIARSICIRLPRGKEC